MLNKILKYFFVGSLILVSCNVNANFLEKKDKQKHILAESVITGISTKLLEDSEHPILYPILIGSTVGLAKEVYDSRAGGSGFSKQDLLADSIGITIGLTAGSSFNIIYSNDFTGIGFRTEF